MSDVQQTIIDAYNAQAAKLAEGYDKTDTLRVFPHLPAWLPALDDSGFGIAFDIACGSGYNANWLAQKGFDVYAVDAARDMIAQGQQRYTHRNLMWRRDICPELPFVTGQGVRADFILCAAYWMHLQPAQRPTMMDSFTKLADENCTLLMNLRHGAPATDRPMFAVDADEVKQLAEARGWRFHLMPQAADTLGRGNVWWQDIYLQRGNHMPPVQIAPFGGP
jgi:SAM-dependent methyltransferase